MQELKISRRCQQRGLTLYPFQEQLVKRMLNAPSTRVYNACTMGLGKSAMAIVYANTIHAESVLITTPASLRVSPWARECDIWYALSKPPSKAILSGKDFTALHTKSLLYRGVMPTPLIVSYDMLVSHKPLRNYVLKRKWDLVISDEVDTLRNLTAQRTLIMGEVWSKCADIMFLSGTPMARSAADLYPVLSTIAPYATNLSPNSKSLLTDFERFTRTFTYIRNTMYGVQYYGVRNADLLKSIMRKEGQFFFRKTKEQVLPDLPEKTYNRVLLNLNVDTSLTASDLNELTYRYEEYDDDLGYNPLMSLLRKELGTAIADCNDAYDFVEHLLKDGRSILIFCWHKAVIAQIRRRLAHHNPLTMHGGHTPAQKQAAVDAFQNGESRVLIGNIVTLGKGWTLTRSSDVVFFEVDWLASTIAQATDRVHRIGQKNAVTAHFLITKNSFHQQMISTLIQRQQMYDRVIED